MAANKNPDEIEFDFEFTDEELNYADASKMTEEELRNHPGMVRYADMKDPIGCNSYQLHMLLKDVDPIRQEEEYGVRKMGKHYYVFMPRFKNFLDMLTGNSERLKVKRIPKDLDPKKSGDGNAVIKLKGLYYLSAVCKFIPFSFLESTIKHQVQKLGEPDQQREQAGCWYADAHKAYVVDMQSFVPWFVRNIFRPYQATQKQKGPRE